MEILYQLIAPFFWWQSLDNLSSIAVYYQHEKGGPKCRLCWGPRANDKSPRHFASSQWRRFLSKFRFGKVLLHVFNNWIWMKVSRSDPPRYWNPLPVSVTANGLYWFSSDCRTFWFFFSPLTAGKNTGVMWNSHREWPHHNPWRSPVPSVMGSRMNHHN